MDAVTIPTTTATRPRLGLLGGLGYWNGSGDVDLAGSAGAVVALVALAGEPIPRSVVAGTIWPEVSERRAGGNLRSVLWRLGRCAPGLVDHHFGSLAIGGAVEVDHRELSGWADRLLRAAPEGDDLERRVAPSQLELVPGRYDDWVVFERERFRQRLLHASEALARLLAEQERYAEAIEAALTAVAADPLRESAHRVTIECHLAEHNVLEARRQQLSYARILSDELGVEPSDDFISLLDGSLPEALRQPLADLRHRGFQ